ncbi:hypothetical protein [Haloarchaeobius iranensis]|uniref:Uncharacterized protein n=1 Tax=Haloarchaeobius iranensis TaxID=996166 RepID=A0A1H0A8C5_9EURY|nr:hypothetical protein [Haloarchaeobius iranensis]SDN29982.1 hypothetical protein SAMN05192554_12544 [Haloarchaeobius iranensis]
MKPADVPGVPEAFVDQLREQGIEELYPPQVGRTIAKSRHPASDVSAVQRGGTTF